MNYLEWLQGLVKATDGDVTYSKLTGRLFVEPFQFFIKNDINRANDGIALRDCYFMNQQNLNLPSSFLSGSCTVLEMLIALANRVEFASSQQIFAVEAFWMMISNLGMANACDNLWEVYGWEGRVSHKLALFLRRYYAKTGEGGLFPLKNTNVDQRKVEIWYQMNAYIDENYPI